MSTPDRNLEFDDGVLSDATAELVILRLYNSMQACFDKTWRPSEIEPT